MNRLWMDRRIVWSALLCAAIAVAFWSGSRYPALSEKALMGGTTILEDPLGFEAVVAVDPGDPLLLRVAATTVNWIATNRQGMTFGLLLAAAFMSLVRLLSDWTLRGSFANSLAGVALGAPLGVCVNCAAPIARGLHSSGARLETSLAAMISSPTLNVIVLAMLISLFPPYMVVIKLSISLAFMLIGIPLLARFAFGDTSLSGADANRIGERQEVLAFGGQQALGPADTEWLSALRWLVRDYTTNLWFIVRRTVPLMLLAGFVGAATMSLLPWEAIAALLPRSGPIAIGTATLALAALGLFLPVPIAFDVVVCAGLLAAGIPAEYVMALLFSLGIFSVYSFMVVWEAVSLRVSASLALSLLALTLVSAATAFVYDERSGASQRSVFERFVSAAHPAPVAAPVATPSPAIPAVSERTALAWDPVADASLPDGVEIMRRRFSDPQPGGDTWFARILGDERGLVRDSPYSLAHKFTAPWYRNTPISAGDVDRDGRVDLLFGAKGLHLFANVDGRHFEPIPIDALEDVPELADGFAANAALVDLNGDGWLDIFVSIYRGGNHILYNDSGHFTADRHVRLPDNGANLANAMAFGDLDRDGDVDVVLGNWTSAIATARPPEGSRNVVLWNRGGDFDVERLEFIPGETLSTLLSDIDRDGDLDLIVGNDFAPPDVFYLGDGRGGLDRLTRDSGVVPETTFSTMSIDSADIDNDLRLEIYSSQITGSAPGQRERMSIRSVAETCAEYADPRWRERCDQRAAAHAVLRKSMDRRDPGFCNQMPSVELRNDCVAFMMLRFTIERQDHDLCAKFPVRWSAFGFICEARFAKIQRYPELEREGFRQIRNRHILLAPTDGPEYEEIGERMGVDLGGWSWNSRFADVDNDSWQDLFVVSGRITNRERESNILYHNRAGTRFDDRTDRSGLRSHLATAAYVYADLDGDGDLEIVTVSVEGPVWVYDNRIGTGNAIEFELFDRVGNRNGIGSQIVIHYDDSRHQLREIKVGGGFVSFDPASAHFGLGDVGSIDRVEVHWSTGERSELIGPFAGGHRYRISRASR